ncbi:gamma-crystallin N [Poecile atricapillus]|uniref:gamma-crystallin N n=1 Tax=Poecile atricapillus TaxID=48891 RepID=UPI002739C7FD|nr:gamma-crystallin N [Poecile atricapillus]
MSLLLTAGPFSSLPQITFYEGRCFTGRKLDICGSCNSFQDQGFLNRVNSICVQSGAWVCFDHPDFRGQQYILEHGEYPDFYRWNGRSDHLGSCRPIGMGQGWDKTCINALKVYGDGACCLRFVEVAMPPGSDDGSSGNMGMETNIGPWHGAWWVLYEEPNYRGRMYVVERGEFSSFNEWQARSASVQSIRRVVNYF